MTDRLLSDCRVLVVEDEILVLLMIQDMLADLGCETMASAATVAKALALLKTQSFDVALLDMNLNGENTYAVADALAASDVPFAFVTGYDNHDIDERYRNRPMLNKPFQFEDLGALLSRIAPK